MTETEDSDVCTKLFGRLEGLKCIGVEVRWAVEDYSVVCACESVTEIYTPYMLSSRCRTWQ